MIDRTPKEHHIRVWDETGLIAEYDAKLTDAQLRQLASDCYRHWHLLEVDGIRNPDYADKDEWMDVQGRA